MEVNMKKYYYIILISVLFIGLLGSFSCKRSSVSDPDANGNSGFKIFLSGTADPSTLYVPFNAPAVYSFITVRATNGDGTPVAFNNIVFQQFGDALYGYFGNKKLSMTSRTNENGMATITYNIPAGTDITSDMTMYVKATLVDDNRVDNSIAEYTDMIPIKLIAYEQQQVVLIRGKVKLEDGSTLTGAIIEGTNNGGVVICGSNGYKLTVPLGYSGTVTPTLNNYSFYPSSYTYDTLTTTMYDQDFIAVPTSFNIMVSPGSVTFDNTVNNTDGVDTVEITFSVSTTNSITAYILRTDDWIYTSADVITTSGSTPNAATFYVGTSQANTIGANRIGTVFISYEGVVVSVSVTQQL
jgi:hypothetical protein